MTSEETQIEGQASAANSTGLTVPEQRRGAIGLSLKAVGDLRDQRFYIPSYQRGYRWEPEQVEALLNDLQEFEQRADVANKFYCLQPLVVVKRQDNEWEVVDGQQRLTTIFLILNRMLPAETPPPFHISYERHPRTEQGLAGLLKLLSPNRHSSSPDFYFIKKADEAIRNWLCEHRLCEHKVRLPSLTNCSGDGCCAKFIWDAISNHGEAIHAFTRLNSGKIRLKDSELIRATLLQSGKLEENLRQRIAIEWDRMEWRLQNPEFWSFLNGKGQAPDSRIEVLFSLLAENEGQGQKRTGDRRIFDKFFGRLKNDVEPAAERIKLWEEVDQLFGTLEEWFEDHCLFHLIGFLIDLLGHDEKKQRRLILNLRDVSQPSEPPSNTPKTKPEFITYLKQEIRNDVLPGLKSAESIKPYLDTLNYGKDEDARQIRRVLLCLNIATLMADKTPTVRFSFAAYQGGEDWDIEHIRATNAGEPGTLDELRDTIGLLCNYLEHLDSTKKHSAELEPAQEEIKSKSPDQNHLSERYRKLCKILQELTGKDAEGNDSMEASDNIRNLTLLDCGTNRGFGNSWFIVKRWWILDIERKKYLLPCTRNVFTKSYSKAPGSLLHWTQTDANDYVAAMVQVLTEFFKDTWETKS